MILQASGTSSRHFFFHLIKSFNTLGVYRVLCILRDEKDGLCLEVIVIYTIISALKTTNVGPQYQNNYRTAVGLLAALYSVWLSTNHTCIPNLPLHVDLLLVYSSSSTPPRLLHAPCYFCLIHSACVLDTRASMHILLSMLISEFTGYWITCYCTTSPYFFHSDLRCTPSDLTKINTAARRQPQQRDQLRYAIKTNTKTKKPTPDATLYDVG